VGPHPHALVTLRRQRWRRAEARRLRKRALV